MVTPFFPGRPWFMPGGGQGPDQPGGQGPDPGWGIPNTAPNDRMARYNAKGWFGRGLHDLGFLPPDNYPYTGANGSRSDAPIFPTRGAPGSSSQLIPAEGPYAGVGAPIGQMPAGTGGAISLAEQDRIMGQIRASIIETGSFNTDLLSQLLPENQMVITQFWGQVRQATIGEDQFAVNTKLKKQEAGLKFFNDLIKNNLDLGKFEEAKRTQRELEKYQQQQLGLDAWEIAKKADQFEKELKQRVIEGQALQQSLADRLAHDQAILRQEGDQFDAELAQRIAEAADLLKATTRTLDLEERGLTIEEAFNEEQIAVQREQLTQQETQFGLTLAQKERSEQIANPFGFAAASMLGLGGGQGGAVPGPGSGAQGLPGPGPGGQGGAVPGPGPGAQGLRAPGQNGQAPFLQGMTNLGFNVAKGAQAGKYTPAREFFSSGLPTQGALREAGPTAGAAIQPFLSFTGTSPEDFQRQSAAVTPRTRQGLR